MTLSPSSRGNIYVVNFDGDGRTPGSDATHDPFGQSTTAIRTGSRPKWQGYPVSPRGD